MNKIANSGNKSLFMDAVIEYGKERKKMNKLSRQLPLPSPG